jgi:TolA-binding protein
MDVGLIAVLIALLSVPIASLFTWTLNKNKDSAQIASLYSEAGQNAVDSIKTALDAVRDQLSEVQEKNKQLHQDLCDLKAQSIQLIKENELLHDDLQDLKNQNKQLISENRAFKRKIDDLTKSIKGMN